MVVPKRNLAPEAEPWGRSVDDAITQLQRSATKNAEDNSNAFSGIASSMQAISKQIADINAQQVALAAQQALITDLLANKIGYVGTDAHTNSIAPGTSYADATSSTITLPSGTTVALIVVIGWTDTLYSGTGGSYASYDSRCTINGTAGSEATKSGVVSYSDPAVMVVQQLIISSPPTSIPVAVQWRKTAGATGTPVGGDARLVAFAIFNK